LPEITPRKIPTTLRTARLTLGHTTTRLRDLTLPAGFIPPCLPMMAPRPPSGPAWLHEIKHDGLRIIARKDSRRTTLYDRLGNDVTQLFPLIAGAMARMPSCTIDGEAVAYDDSGVPSFDLLRRRQRGDRAFLHVFDLIELAGNDQRRDPLEQRKFDLSRLLADTSQGLLLNPWIDGENIDGATVFERVCSAGLEGIVSKRKDARYISGRSPYWLKMKNPTSKAARGEAEDELAKHSVYSVESPETPQSPT
jgi:bifunctional non-homologous end joining protein LigD